MATEKGIPIPNAPQQAARYPTHVLVHYDEIMLKQRNRSRFERDLHRSVRRALEDLEGVTAQRVHGRLIVELGEAASPDRVLRRLAKVCGVTRIVPATRLGPDVDAMKDWLDANLIATRSPSPRTFRIRTRRADKSFPLGSVELNADIGDFVRERTGWKVDLDTADVTVYIRILPRAAYIGFEERAGPGGLPIGSTGLVLSLISGGIDSPVASHFLLRRGAATVFVHFHSHPHTSLASQDKVRELVRQILPTGHRARLWMLPFAPLQQTITVRCPARLRVLLYRRYMLRAAAAIAERVGALALVTGDNLGQVASQTLENLCAIESAVDLPVLRPLVGLHKRHIIDEARRIGTYATSIEPHDDCCSFLMPANPATRSTPAELTAAEGEIDTASEILRLLETATVETLEGSE